MRFDFNKLDIGDVLVTRSNYKGSFFVRLGACLRGRSGKVDHVIVVHHRDDAGTLWGIEGTPSSVGYVQLKRYADDKYANANVDQPKTAAQRTQIATLAEGMLGTPYDWAGIVLDGMREIGAEELWHSREWPDGLKPSHVVCSSFADYIYEVVELANPGGSTQTRGTEPSDWDDFISDRQWLI